MPSSEPLDTDHATERSSERKTASRMTIRHAALSDVGLRRTRNEDHFLLEPDLGLFVVADGMGGHAGGEVASAMATETVGAEIRAAWLERPELFSDSSPLPQSPLAALLRNAVETASSVIFQEAKNNPELTGMGSTMTAVLLGDGILVAGHVGDSRLYIDRDDLFQQLTEDHSLVYEQVRAGILSHEEAAQSRHKNVITRSIGNQEDVLVDVFGLHVESGDTLLLCTDGLSNLVEDYEMREILRTSDLERATQELIALANARGGDDNITAVVVRLEEGGVGD